MRYGILVLFLGLTIGSAQVQASLLEGFDALGGNDALLEQARALNPEQEVRVVQERAVSRRNRGEFTMGYSYFFSGDVYVDTQSLDLGYQFHLTPRWSLGINYFSSLNRLSSEGVALTQNDLPERLPEDRRFILDLDPLEGGYHGSLNFYPFYGKLNFLGLSIVHFDSYLFGGYGRAILTSGPAESYIYGGGVGVWLTQSLSARVEIRNHSYTSQRNLGDYNLTRTAGSLSVGYLL